jgi:drug/metabolite transporter (DMT)-like permease
MDLFVFCAVLAAAAFHATWNALLKVKLEPIVAICVISVGCGIAVLPVLPFVDLPRPAAWPYIGGSLFVHLFYYSALAEAYKTGDLGLVYPIARGSAPFMTATGAYLLVGQELGPLGWFGVAVLASGILVLSFKGGRVSAKPNLRSAGFALVTALTITTYTLIDAIGAKVAGSAHAYAGWLFILDAVMMAAYGLLRFPAAFVGAMKSEPRLLFVGGGLSAAAYWIAIWAMTVAPIALVAALRETSVLFAAAIGIVFLREPVIPARIIAACLVLIGVVLIRLR